MAKTKQNDFAVSFGFDKPQPSSIKVGKLDDAYKHWHEHPGPDNLKSLLDASQPTLSKALMSFAGGDQSYMGVAKKLAIDAFKGYDPSKQTKLRTHLLIRLQPLQREYMKRTTPLAIPERVQLDRRRIGQEETIFKDEYGRDPSDIELADATGLSTKRIAHVRRFASKVMAESQMVTPEGDPYQPATQRVDPANTWVEYVHHDLDPISQQILEWKTGLYDKPVLSTNEIAKRLKITPSAVSQRSAKIADKLEKMNAGSDRS